MDQSSIGCDTQMSLSEGDSIGRWYRRYFGITRRDERRSHFRFQADNAKASPLADLVNMAARLRLAPARTN